MNKLAAIVFLIFASCSSQKNVQQAANTDDIQRILKTLSSDDMQGRASFTQGAEKAASFIESEFKKIGLVPMQGQTAYRQNFTSTKISRKSADVSVNGMKVGTQHFAVMTDKSSFNWNNNAQVMHIKAGENLRTRFQEITALNQEALVLVDSSFIDDFGKLKAYLDQERVIEKKNETRAVVFILGPSTADNYIVNVENKIEDSPLFNVVGIIPGKSRPNEIVIVSAHYDHIGILNPVNGDSIANGADDDASGTTAVIALASRFKAAGNNERTLMFVAFTAEELGLIGSKYFSNQVNADSVIAMLNIEMIGKESKFGKNAAFISGFERSDLGTILQKNLQGTQFTFHPDPYKEQNLFYRSDNASLAAKGVPAHTISTDQIDIDKYYHTVDDEYETLDVENIKATVEAIALSARGIVTGTDTPTRVAKVEN